MSRVFRIDSHEAPPPLDRPPPGRRLHRPGKLYAASARGELTVFRAGTKLEVLSSADLDERLMATPALADGIVYVRTEKRLLAFGLDG